MDQCKTDRRKETMTKLLNKDLATSLTALLFAVIGVSGVMMFFHFFDNYVKEMHEILGLAFIAGVLLHVFFNFKAFKKYFGKGVFLLVTLATLVTATVFVLQVDDKPDPKRAMIETVFNSSVQNYAEFLHVEIQAVEQNLAKAGIVTDMQESINLTAQKNKISPFKLIGIIINESKAQTDK